MGDEYDDALNALSRQPVTLVVVTMDYCQNTFGITDEFEISTQQDLKTGGDGAKANGWHVLNSANADAIDIDISNSGKLTIDHGGAHTGWGGTREDGPFVYKNVTGDFDVNTGIADNADETSELAHLLVRDPGASAGYDNLYIRRGIVGGVPTVQTRNTANTVALDNQNFTASDSYLRITRAGNVFTLYSKANAGDPWTQRAQYTRDDFAETVQVGVAAATYNTNNNYVVQFDYFRTPCTATGTPCYNTFPTCKDVPNYAAGTKDYKFATREGAVDGARPYLRQATDLPTKIQKSLSVKGRMKVTLADELDDDTGFDPYVTQRVAFPDIPGTWAKKWLARNYNFRGRRVVRKDGFLGIAEGSYVQTWEGRIEDINLTGTELTIEAVDLLGDLDKIKVPAKIDCKLVANISETDVEATLSDVSELPDSGHLVLGKEIIHYTAKNSTTNQVTGLTRGIEGTTAAAHNSNEKVGLARHYQGNPFDILQEMLTDDAGIGGTFIDTAAFTYWRGTPPEGPDPGTAGIEEEPDFEAFIVKETSLKELYFELVEHCLAQSWVGEDLKITIRRDVPNAPGRAYRDLTGRGNFTDPKLPVDWNDKERRSRYALYWDRADHFADDKDDAAYMRRDIGVWADAESANDMGAPDEETVYSRWVRTGLATEEELDRYVTNLVSRRVLQLKDPRSVITAMLDRKDQGIRTGEWVRVDTKAVLNPDGMPLSREKFQVIERSVKGNGVQVKLKRAARDMYLCIAPDTLMQNEVPLDWGAASDDDKEYGSICADDLLSPSVQSKIL